MKKISIEVLKDILEKMPKERVEVECHAWGCCTPHYRDIITAEDVIQEVERYLKNK